MIYRSNIATFDLRDVLFVARIGKTTVRVMFKNGEQLNIENPGPASADSIFAEIADKVAKQEVP